MSRRVHKAEKMNFDTYMKNRDLIQKNALILRRKRLFAVLVLVSFFLFSGICAYYGVAESKAACPMAFSVASVEVTGNDTLWSIAKDNFNPEHGTFRDYIEEIKECNGLATDTIHAGSSLLIPIYTSK